MNIEERFGLYLLTIFGLILLIGIILFFSYSTKLMKIFGKRESDELLKNLILGITSGAVVLIVQGTVEIWKKFPFLSFKGILTALLMAFLILFIFVCALLAVVFSKKT